MNDSFNPDPMPPLEPLLGTTEDEPLELPPPVEPPRRFPIGYVVGVVGLGLAWLAIVGAVGYMVAQRQLKPAARVGGTNRLALVVHLLQSRYLVGAGQLIKLLEPDRGAELYEQSEKMLNTGTVDQRLRSVVVAGELAGPDEALKKLDELEQKAHEQSVEMTPEQRRTLAALRRLYQDYSRKETGGPSVGEGDRQLLRQELDWFGELALAPSGADKSNRSTVLWPAWRTAIAFLGTFTVAGGLAFFGLFGLLTLVILICVGKLRGGLRTGSGHGGVYAETFALWMLLFVGLGYGGSLLSMPPAARMPVQGLGMLCSLVAVFWPVVRGVPWSVVRQEIGWTAGRRPWLEPLLGPVCYIMTLPILAIGLALTIVLAKVFGGLPGLGLLGDAANDFAAPDTAAHPIVGIVAGGAWYERLTVLALASLVAPIVEETMFRGVLYRHLRELTGRAGPFLSVIFSGTVVSFIFAVIHPQGLVAVPILMAMAYGFTIAREWRETLIPAMVAHGLNNGMVMCLLIFVLGG